MSTQSIILRALSMAPGPVTLSYLVGATGVARHNVQNALYQLVDRGFINEVPQTFTIKPEGEQRIEWYKTKGRA